MIRIGCSGWNYAVWRESFYPKGLPASRWLERWVQQASSGFCFAVKASRYLTHVKRLAFALDHLPPGATRSSSPRVLFAPEVYELLRWHNVA